MLKVVLYILALLFVFQNCTHRSNCNGFLEAYKAHLCYKDGDIRLYRSLKGKELKIIFRDAYYAEPSSKNCVRKSYSLHYECYPCTEHGHIIGYDSLGNKRLSIYANVTPLVGSTDYNISVGWQGDVRGYKYNDSDFYYSFGVRFHPTLLSVLI